MLVSSWIAISTEFSAANSQAIARSRSKPPVQQRLAFLRNVERNRAALEQREPVLLDRRRLAEGLARQMLGRLLFRPQRYVRTR